MNAGFVELLRKAVAAYATGKTSSYAKTSEMFGISTAAFTRAWRQYRESGVVRHKPKGGNHRPAINDTWLIAFMSKTPDARMSDVQYAWTECRHKTVSLGAVWNALQRIGWTHKKKTPEAYERERADLMARRAAFAQAQPQLVSQRLVFVDESGFRLGGTPRYGWSPRGVDAPGTLVCGAWKQLTMLGAIALDGLRGFMTIEGGTSTAVFLAFINQVLGPQLRDGDIVVMDNLAAHKNVDVIRAIKAFGAQPLFVPPYSPEFNPIEKTWGTLKDILRRARTKTVDLFDQSIAEALQQITTTQIAGWIRHAGYSVLST